MKKIYLMAAFLGATTFAFNQVQKLPAKLSKNTEKMVSSNAYTQKAVGQTMWSSDFSDPTDWVIGGNGQQGTWQIGTVTDLPNPNFYFNIESTTASNGFAFFEGVGFLLSPPVMAQNAWIEMAGTVDLTGEAVVTFKFEQEYRAFNTDKTYVEVSLDGGATWVQTTDVNAGITANNHTQENVVFRNFTVDGSNNVKFRFRWENESTDNDYGSGYAWQVDDVEIMTLSDNDIKITEFKKGSSIGTVNTDTLTYGQIPLSQAAPISGKALLKNEGTQAQTNVVLIGYETLSNNYTSASAPVNVAANGTGSAAVSTNFTPTANGTYRLEYGITADQVDDVPSNNYVAPYTFRVGDYTYARDISTTAETHLVIGGYFSGHDANPDDASAIEIGNIFHIYNTQDVTGIDFKFGPEYSEGANIRGQILDDALEPILNAETATYTTQANDSGRYVTLKFDTPVTLTPGEYVVTVTSYETEFSVAASGVSLPQTSFIYYEAEDTWYYTNSTPIVRMNFSPHIDCAQDPTFNYGNIGNACIASGGVVSPNLIASSGGTFSFDTAPTDGATIDGATGVITGATAGTSYEVKYVTADGVCQEINTVTVNEYPTVVATATPAVSCEGAPVTLTASGAGSYFWGVDLGDGATKTVSPTATTTYSVIGYNGYCRDTAQIEVVYGMFDDASFAYSNFCAATTTNNVPYNVVTGGGTFDFNPAVTDGATIDGTTGEISGAISGNDYTIEYTTSGDCPSTETVTITVSDTDDASFTYADVCFGETLTPTNIATAGGSFTFDTAPGSTETIDATTGVISGAVAGTSYDVLYTTDGGPSCEGSSVETVEVFELPTVTAVATETEICEDETTQITASGADTYTWSNGETGAELVVTTGAIYTATGVDANGCSAESAGVEIIVNPLPVITFADETVCESVTEIALTATPEGGTFTGTGVTGSDLAVSGIGTYEVTYTYTDATTGCENSETATFTVEACASLAENELTRLVIAPNPASTSFEVRVEGNNKINDVQLVSLQGQIVPAKYTTVDTQTTIVDVSQLVSGTYFIQLTTENGQLTKKVVIQ